MTSSVLVQTKQPVLTHFHVLFKLGRWVWNVGFGPPTSDTEVKPFSTSSHRKPQAPDGTEQSPLPWRGFHPSHILIKRTILFLEVPFWYLLCPWHCHQSWSNTLGYNRVPSVTPNQLLSIFSQVCSNFSLPQTTVNWTAKKLIKWKFWPYV